MTKEKQIQKIQIDPILSWPGGKRRQAKNLIAMMPPHKCFVEVFAGGAAVFFARPIRAKCEVINDFNGELINLYNVVRQDLEGLRAELAWSISSRTLFNQHKAADLTKLTNVQRAARFAYLQQHSFGAKVTGQTFGTSATGRMPSMQSLLARLEAAHQRLDGVCIENLAWQECIKKYDRPHTLFYLDPPYWRLAGYGVKFGWEQYVDMADMMAKAQVKIMLSINDHSDIMELFKEFRHQVIDVNYSNGRRNGKGSTKASREIIYFNW